MLEYILQVIASGVGIWCFAVTFNAPKKEYLYCAINGAVSWLMYLVFCWLGAGVIVMPGVTIGDGSVIGAGSIVTKDIPAGVVAYGNPCRVVRQISERDREYYFKDKKINWDEIV